MIWKEQHVNFSIIFRGAALAALLVASPAFAQDEDEPLPNDPNNLTIGVGGAYVPSYDGSDDYELIPVGLIRGKVSGFGFSTRGTALYIDLIRDDPNSDYSFEFGPVANVRLDRTGRIKDAQVRALGEIDRAIEVGAYAGFAKNKLLHRYDSLGFSITWQHDVTNTHDSAIITPSIQYTTPLSERTLVQLGVQAEHVGAGYGLTYFSVSPVGSAASGLPVYTTDGGWKDYRISLFGAQMLSGDLRHPKFSLFAGVSYSKLLGDFKRSPIVAIAGDSDQYFATVGLAYSF
jgi:outer membrane scaffolding protein for murein synthesis (MipA/OmpV family)